VKAAYKAAIGLGWVTPTEFWRLHPDDFFWLWETKQPRKTDKFSDLYELLG